MTPIECAVAEFKPVKLFAMFSGGNDSLCETHYAMEHGAHEVFHIRTGIGVAETTEFVRDTCRQFGWPLIIKDPPDWDYRKMVLTHGFPGPGGHLYPYSWLKERAIKQLVRETKTKWSDRVGLITGVRNTESARRMGYVKPVIRFGACVWIAPLFDFSELDIHDYIAAHRLTSNPVLKILGFSGECLCGAFAEDPPSIELNKLAEHFPETYKKIMDLQDEARIAGKPCQWGVRPPKRVDPNQYDIPFMPLCVGCHVRS